MDIKKKGCVAMKKITFIAVFLSTHVLLVFLQIYKHSQYIKISYARQTNECRKEELMHRVQKLTHQLQTLKKSSTISTLAKKSGMRNVKINQIHTLPTHE